MVPPIIAKITAKITLLAGLKPNGANKPGIGEAVPGALLMILKWAADTPAKAPPKKFEAYICTGF